MSGTSLVIAVESFGDFSYGAQPPWVVRVEVGEGNPEHCRGPVKPHKDRQRSSNNGNPLRQVHHSNLQGKPSKEYA